jgi:hypothetical protein
MRRLHWGLLGACLPMGALCVALAGCGGGTEPAVSSDKGTDSTKDNKATETKVRWIPAGKGVITGKVTLKGDKPDFAKLNNELRAEIDKNQNKDFCLMGTGTDLDQQGYRINDKGEVENVFVWIMPAEKNAYFEIDNAEQFAKEQDIDQPHCAFHPHALIAFPQYHDSKDAKGKLKATGQKVIVKNSANATHNTNYKNASGTIPGDNQLLKNGETMELKGLMPSYKEPVQLKCNIHGWMDAYVWCFDHPYAAVTKPDGTFKMENVPTGAKLKIVAWHEKATWLNGQNGEAIEVKDSGETTKDFQMSAK